MRYCRPVDSAIGESKQPARNSLQRSNHTSRTGDSDQLHLQLPPATCRLHSSTRKAPTSGIENLQQFGGTRTGSTGSIGSKSRPRSPNKEFHPQKYRRLGTGNGEEADEGQREGWPDIASLLDCDSLYPSNNGNQWRSSVVLVCAAQKQFFLSGTRLAPDQNSPALVPTDMYGERVPRSPLFLR